MGVGGRRLGVERVGDGGLDVTAPCCIVSGMTDAHSTAELAKLALAGYEDAAEELFARDPEARRLHAAIHFAGETEAGKYWADRTDSADFDAVADFQAMMELSTPKTDAARDAYRAYLTGLADEAR